MAHHLELRVGLARRKSESHFNSNHQHPQPRRRQHQSAQREYEGKHFVLQSAGGRESVRYQGQPHQQENRADDEEHGGNGARASRAVVEKTGHRWQSAPESLPLIVACFAPVVPPSFRDMIYKMTRRALLSLPLAIAQAQTGPRRPNVVILLADDLGWADVGFHGGNIRTPNIDSLAREGVQLDRFYSCPVCSPTRSALMTGRWPMRLGIGYTVVRPWADYGVPLEEHLMPQSFKAAGYQTAMAGKWHLGHQRRAYFPGSRGFDSSYGHFNGAIDYYTHDREGGLDWHRDGKTLLEAGYSTELIGAEAVRRIRARDKSRPFLLYVPFNAPHAPLQAPQTSIDRYANVKDQKRRVFSAMVDAMDRQVGAILKTLDEEAIAQDTIVLFFSDNGGPVNLGANNTPLRGAKASVYEGGIRVPAVMRWPGKIKAGSKSAQVMAAWDVFPTLAAAAGIKPAGKLPLDGTSYWQQIASQTRTLHENVFFAIENGAQQQHCVLHREWKLIRQGESEHTLFNVEEDPTEKKDVAAAHPALVRELSARIDEWKKLHPPLGMRWSSEVPKGWRAPKRWADDTPQ